MITRKTFADVVMNPVRQRIIQFLIVKGEGTVADISEALSDVPKPSLYRHVRVLSEAGCLRVTGEKAARGAVERTYALSASLPGLEPTRENIAMVFQTSLMNLSGRFADYFSSESADPAADKLGLSSATLMLTDAEYDELFKRIGELYAAYMGNSPENGRKPRLITIISSPVEVKEVEK